MTGNMKCRGPIVLDIVIAYSTLLFLYEAITIMKYRLASLGGGGPIVSIREQEWHKSQLAYVGQYATLHCNASHAPREGTFPGSPLSIQ